MDLTTFSPFALGNKKRFGLFQMLAESEKAYRQKRQLKNTANSHLADMGITRHQADQEFHRRFAQKAGLDGR